MAPRALCVPVNSLTSPAPTCSLAKSSWDTLALLVQECSGIPPPQGLCPCCSLALDCSSLRYQFLLLLEALAQRHLFNEDILIKPQHAHPR